MSELQKTHASQDGTPPRLAGPVGIVFAGTKESGCFEDRLSGATTLHGAGFTVHEGGLNGRRVVVLTTGEGAEPTERGVEALIAGHRPSWIISAGFAQALDDQLSHGEVFLAERFVDAAGQELTPDWPADLTAIRDRLKLRSGRLLSVERPPRGPDEKRALGHQHQAIAADPQAFFVGTVCRREAIRFLAVRVIAETVDSRLPADVAHLTSRPTLARRLGALAGALVHRPGSIKDVWNHYEATVAASAALAKALVELIALLP